MPEEDPLEGMFDLHEKYTVNVDFQTTNAPGNANVNCHKASHQTWGRHYDITIHKLNSRHARENRHDEYPGRFWEWGTTVPQGLRQQNHFDTLIKAQEWAVRILSKCSHQLHHGHRVGIRHCMPCLRGNLNSLTIQTVTGTIENLEPGHATYACGKLRLHDNTLLPFIVSPVPYGHLQNGIQQGAQVSWYGKIIGDNAERRLWVLGNAAELQNQS